MNQRIDEYFVQRNVHQTFVLKLIYLLLGQDETYLSVNLFVFHSFNQALSLSGF